MSQFGWHDCPAGVKTQIERLTDGLKLELKNNLVGVYLHGSLAMGCFNPLRSDIDLLVVTRGKLSLETKRALARRLLEISNQPAPFEISFLATGDLHPWRHPTPYNFHYSEDWREKFVRAHKDGDWQNWNSEERFDGDLAGHVTVLNHRGRCLYGEAIADVFPPVPEADFVASILADVLSANFGLGGAFEKFPVYVVLNACRTLAYLKTGRVLSKAEGGSWALENLPARFTQTVTDALDEYRAGRNDQSNLREKNLAEFSAYMKNEIERAKP